MKKVLLTGAALMLAGGMVSTASAAAVEPGVKITGDARIRLFYMSEEYKNTFGITPDPVGAPYDSQTNLDTRVRLDITGTAAGGAYAKARVRMYESVMGDMDTDLNGAKDLNGTNIWVDKAYIGIPFNDTFTVEVGKYRSTYGPLPTTNNFFYDDVHLTGARGIIKIDNVEINPFIEWMEEAQTDEYKNATNKADYNADNDEIRFGVHAKAKLNKDWTIGGMLGYQSDSRTEYAYTTNAYTGFEANEGFFGSLYGTGKAGQFAISGEFAVTAAELNGLNAFYDDSNASITADPAKYILAVNALDNIGSDDTGFGGYIFPNYQIDKLNIGLNVGFTANGFQPDRAFGFVMLGGEDNSKITDYAIGKGGDWMWAGLVVSYQIDEALKLTGNIVYGDVDAYDAPTATEHEGPLGGMASSSTTAINNAYALDSAWELSAVLQYTISKGADVYFSAGYLSPSFENSALNDDGAFGALTRFELKF